MFSKTLLYSIYLLFTIMLRNFWCTKTRRKKYVHYLHHHTKIKIWHKNEDIRYIEMFSMVPAAAKHSLTQRLFKNALRSRQRFSITTNNKNTKHHTQAYFLNKINIILHFFYLLRCLSHICLALYIEELSLEIQVTT